MQHKRPHGHPLRCCSSACEATTVEIRVVTIGCTCMEQGGGWRRERAAFTVNARGRLDCATFFFTAACGPRHESCSSDEVVESLWPGRPQLWPHCGYQCSAGVCCALRKRAKFRVTAVCAQPAVCVRAGTCVWTHGIARQCANVSQMIQQPKVTLYPATGSPRGAVHRGPTLHTALTAQAPRGRRDPSSD